MGESRAKRVSAPAGSVRALLICWNFGSCSRLGLKWVRIKFRSSLSEVRVLFSALE